MRYIVIVATVFLFLPNNKHISRNIVYVQECCLVTMKLKKSPPCIKIYKKNVEHKIYYKMKKKFLNNKNLFKDYYRYNK